MILIFGGDERYHHFSSGEILKYQIPRNPSLVTELTNAKIRVVIQFPAAIIYTLFYLSILWRELYLEKVKYLYKLTRILKAAASGEPVSGLVYHWPSWKEKERKETRAEWNQDFGYS